MPRPRTTPVAAYFEIAQVGRQRDAIPSDRELAVKYHISEQYVRRLMKLARRGLLDLSKYANSDVSRDSNFPSEPEVQKTPENTVVLVQSECSGSG